jgi:hypothetical protein
MKLLDSNDQKDNQILRRRFAAWEAIKGPRMGDYVIYPDGHSERISYDWGSKVQTSDAKFGSSFYLEECGYVSFSGGLNPPVPKNKLRETGRTLDGAFWFFHQDWWQADNGVGFELPCRVFELTEAAQMTRKQIAELKDNCHGSAAKVEQTLPNNQD